VARAVGGKRRLADRARRIRPAGKRYFLVKLLRHFLDPAIGFTPPKTSPDLDMRGLKIKKAVVTHSR
jgi:hypothetical protein